MTCRLCPALVDCKSVVSNFDQSADMRSHSRKHHIQMGLISQSSDAEEVFRKCFPEINSADETGRDGDRVEKSGTTKSAVGLASSGGSKIQISKKKGKRNKRLTMRTWKFDMCRRYINKFARSGLVDCRKCSKSIRADGWGMVDHASTHLEKIMFECPHCSRGFTGYVALKNHLRRRHNRSMKDGFVDNSDRYRDEIKAELVECYGELAAEEEEEASAIEQYRFSIRSLIDRLISARNRRIDCRQCGKSICVYFQCAIIHHAMVHLNKDVYECRSCGEAYTNNIAVSNHIRFKHNTSAKGMFIDHSQKYEDEIKAEMCKCFGEVTESECK